MPIWFFKLAFKTFPTISNLSTVKAHISAKYLNRRLQHQHSAYFPSFAPLNAFQTIKIHRMLLETDENAWYYTRKSHVCSSIFRNFFFFLPSLAWLTHTKNNNIKWKWASSPPIHRKKKQANITLYILSMSSFKHSFMRYVSIILVAFVRLNSRAPPPRKIKWKKLSLHVIVVSLCVCFSRLLKLRLKFVYQSIEYRVMCSIFLCKYSLHNNNEQKQQQQKIDWIIVKTFNILTGKTWRFSLIIAYWKLIYEFRAVCFHLCHMKNLRWNAHILYNTNGCCFLFSFSFFLSRASIFNRTAEILEHSYACKERIRIHFQSVCLCYFICGMHIAL